MQLQLPPPPPSFRHSRGHGKIIGRYTFVCCIVKVMIPKVLFQGLKNVTHWLQRASLTNQTSHVHNCFPFDLFFYRFLSNQCKLRSNHAIKPCNQNNNHHNCFYKSC